jgi:predicted nicotinamide N-methyase
VVGGRQVLVSNSTFTPQTHQSSCSRGTVVWKITPLFASWVTSPGNVLFRHRVLSSNSSVLELGCGISGIIAMTLGPLVMSYIPTDQEYVLRILNQNLASNRPQSHASASKGRKSSSKPKRGSAAVVEVPQQSNVTAKPLDWETDEVSSSVIEDNMKSFDVVIACDCIYNDALIQPLVQTCVDACQLRRNDLAGPTTEPTLCIIAQQLRSDEVFEAWLLEFHKFFHVWRVPDEVLTPELQSGTGFVLHFGVLR